MHPSAQGNGTLHIANGRSRSRQNDPQRHQASNQFDAETIVSDYEDEGSSERGEDGGEGDQSIPGKIMEACHSPDFIKYQKNFACSTNGDDQPAFIQMPRNARGVAGRSPSESLVPGGRTAYLDTHRQLVDKLRTNVHVERAQSLRVDDEIQHEETPITAVQHRLVPGNVGKAYQIPSRTPSPTSATIRTKADATPISNKADLASERPAEQKATLPAESTFNNDSFGILDLSDDEALEKETDSESNEGAVGRKRPRDLDHSHDQLSGMTFEQLRDEPFEFGCAPVSTILPPEVAGAPLPTQLDHLFGLAETADRDDQQQTFFDSLTIEQYADCGDILSTKFSDAIAKLSATRRQKRDVAGQFEAEIAKREELIRSKCAALANEKQKLKQNGMGVLKGRISQG